MTNTDSDIVLDMAGQESFVLISGRWYKSKSMKPPWEFVKPDALPAEFKKIPEPSPIGEVLTSVAGTPQAEDALAEAQVPQTAAIKRNEAKTKVEYHGEPQFKPIPDTEVAYAVNTASQVLKIKGKYYVVVQAVWFVGSSPNGPWTLSDKAPPEAQQIPPDSPVYNVKYVAVYDTTPEVVYVGYYPGYVGCYPYYGTVVWGTGWYYPPYISPYAYYPRPVTFGFSAHYNPYSGWSLGFSISSGPFTFSFWGGGYYGGGYYGGYYGPVYRPPYYGRSRWGGWSRWCRSRWSGRGGRELVGWRSGWGRRSWRCWRGGGVGGPEVPLSCPRVGWRSASLSAARWRTGTNSNIYNRPENKGRYRIDNG